ncbi:MAG: hypothetical protein CME62_11255 [Halobacteriovoraceae bacterium]|nr:hypothetical protein [Halobacteriovoraceae bacterium]|tara:strand:+ start:7864 stop:9156 length:1293 start_codon:yes stop_codon:yes gene_type:complete
MAKKDFETETSIAPFAASEKLNDKYKSIRLKIPLTESSIGYYELEEVLGNENLDSRRKGFFKRLWDGIKFETFKFFVSLGVSNSVKYSTYFDFDGKIDPDFLKSARVTRVFFTAEDCRAEERDCNTKKDYRSNFDFVDEVIVNISNFEDETHVDTLNEQEEIENLDKAEFRKISDQASGQFSSSHQFKIVGKSDHEVKPEHLTGEGFQELTIVKYKNQYPELRLDTSQISDEEKDLFLAIDDGNRRKLIRRYFKLDKFKPYLRDVDSDRDGVYLELKSNARISQVAAIVKADQSSTTNRQKMFIFRLNSKLRETEKFFKGDKFKNVVRDATMIGRSLYVELKDISQINRFNQILSKNKKYMDRKLDIYKMDRCGSSNCIDLETKNINIVPMLVKNPKLKINTYASMRELEGYDFKYNGYIEIEIDVEFPF